MPYLDCQSCRLTVYSAASHSTQDHCPRCGSLLGKPAPLFRFERPLRLPRTRREWGRTDLVR